MKRFPKIRRLAKVEFTPTEFMDCITIVEATMRRMGARDPHDRLEMIGGFYQDVEKATAFEARMQCMREIHSSPRAAEFTRGDPGSGMVSRVGLFHAAALAPLHYDDDNQFFDETEFFDIAELKQKALIAAM